MMARSSSNPPKKRHTLTDGDRQRIRKQYKEHLGQQSILIAWYLQQTGFKLDQSQISRILSSKYDYLDTLDTRKDKGRLEHKRSSRGDWPELEAALFEWQQRMQNKKAVITGEILKGQAVKLWDNLSQYQGLEPPKFSNGWLEGFKTRFKIKEYVQHGEASSAAVNDSNSIKSMQHVRDLAAQYGPENTYNMDETGLFWKLVPERTLATEAGSGGKKSKDRITLALTCNVDGSDKLEPWIIGRSKNPRCLKHIKNRRLLRIEYRYNKSKWMTGLIMQEYLQWLDNKMRAKGKKILLLLDNFSGHELGVQLVGGLEGLGNVQIAWLPANTTSHWQPLDQGIIASFKLQYRRLWVAYMLRQYEACKDPNKTVTLLKAIQWTRIAWNDIITQATIQKCFWKSTVLQKPIDEATISIVTAATIEDQTERIELQAQITALPGITDPLAINDFIEPINEIIEDRDEDIFTSVVEHYSADKEEEELEDDGEEEEPKVSINAVIQALETLKLWELQQDDGNTANLRLYDSIGSRMKYSQAQSKRQGTLDSFFK
jgi:hypothetical protein